ncbi:unnamed protein product [Adineta ricciae]|uniref:Uncharacterized protein n=1 Tax=Adineta ricciae TaxID=249248 RepID=A0A815UTQ6_ADIRI|nr:unnamed protein product [Adineta ricciae]
MYIFRSGEFSSAWMPYTNFVGTRRMIVNFDKTHLSMSIFRHANAKDTQFYRSNLDAVDFNRANLQKANFTKTNITKSQLRSALSIQNAQLPDETLGRDLNLIDNGPATCNSSLLGKWKLITGKIVRMISNIDNNCVFILQSFDNKALMLQHINLSQVWDSHLWPYSQAILFIQMTNGVSIQLSGISKNGKIINQRNLSFIEENITMRLHNEMHILEILVEFNIYSNKTQMNKSWCKDMEMFIDYDIESEFLQTPIRGTPTEIYPTARWQQNGSIVAGGNGRNNRLDQLSKPYGLYIDNDQTVYIADTSNHRIVSWKLNATIGELVAGGI